MKKDEEGLPIPDQPHLQENKDERVFKVFLMGIFSTEEVI